MADQYDKMQGTMMDVKDHPDSNIPMTDVSGQLHFNGNPAAYITQDRQDAYKNNIKDLNAVSKFRK